MLSVGKQNDRAIMGDSTECLKKLERALEYDPGSHYSVFSPKEISQDVKEIPALNKAFTAALFATTKTQKQPVSTNT